MLVVSPLSAAVEVALSSEETVLGARLLVVSKLIAVLVSVDGLVEDELEDGWGSVEVPATGILEEPVVMERKVV